MSGAGVVDLVSGQAHSRLRRVVNAYHGYSERTAGPTERAELPHGGVTVVVNLGPPLLIDGTRVGSFAAGLYERPAQTEHPGEQAGLQLYLAPPAARMLLGLPLAELAHRAVALEDLLGGAAAELPERLESLPDWPARFALMDAFLARRLAHARPPAPALLQAWARLVATGGRARIETIAAEAGWSRRHLAARFGHELGLAPKAYARVLRFERAVSALRAPDAPPAAEVAAAVGYADQPHLTREFRALGATTPGALLRDHPSFADEQVRAPS